METCFAAHHHFLAIKICSSFHGNTRSFLKVFGGMHSLCVVFCAHISRRWAPLCLCGGALVKLSFLILKQIPSSFFCTCVPSKIFSGNPQHFHDIWSGLQLEYLAFFKSTLTNVYPHVKKASSLMCPLSKNLCLTTMVTKKLTPNRDCHVSPKNVGAGLQLLYRIVVGKENGVQTTWLHHTVQ